MLLHYLVHKYFVCVFWNFTELPSIWKRFNGSHYSVTDIHVSYIFFRYKGVREGTISANTSYYIFTQCGDGAFEAFPIDVWYNFTPIIKYKYLNSEEAEEEFTRYTRDCIPEQYPGVLWIYLCFATAPYAEISSVHSTINCYNPICFQCDVHISFHGSWPQMILVIFVFKMVDVFCEFEFEFNIYLNSLILIFRLFH